MIYSRPLLRATNEVTYVNHLAYGTANKFNPKWQSNPRPHDYSPLPYSLGQGATLYFIQKSLEADYYFDCKFCLNPNEKDFLQ